MCLREAFCEATGITLNVFIVILDDDELEDIEKPEEKKTEIYRTKAEIRVTETGRDSVDHKSDMSMYLTGTDYSASLDVCRCEITNLFYVNFNLCMHTGVMNDNVQELSRSLVTAAVAGQRRELALLTSDVLAYSNHLTDAAYRILPYCTSADRYVTITDMLPLLTCYHCLVCVTIVC